MQEKIIELFEMMTRGDQLDLLRKLNTIVNNENPVIEVNLRCQSKFGKNIEFKITTNNEISPPVITAEIITPWGIYFAEGSNKKIAKTKAAEIALAALQEQD